jgi:hypothetical protein
VRNLSFMALSVAAAFIVLAACTTGSSNTALPPAPSNPAPVVASSAAPFGDAADVGPPDVASIQAQRIGPPGAAYTEVVVSLTFEKPNPSTPPPEIADNSAFAKFPAAGTSCITALGPEYCGEIEINTGIASISGFCNLNVDFVVDLGTIAAIGADGKAKVFSNATGFEGAMTGEAAISGGGNVVNVYIPISAIGGNGAGPFNVDAAIGNNAGPTDCSPGSGYMLDSIGGRTLSVGGATQMPKTWR